MFFPKERSEAEVIARNYALDHIRKNKIPVPDKNAPPSVPTRKIYDSVFKDSYSEEFQRRFIPVDMFLRPSVISILLPLRSFKNVLLLMTTFLMFSKL